MRILQIGPLYHRQAEAPSAPGNNLYGAKYPEMSRISCVNPAAYASMEPSSVGTIAMFDVTEPSEAFRVETLGCVSLCGHSVRYDIGPGGATVALNTKAFDVSGGAHGLVTTSIPFGEL